jgi:type III secretion protein L
MAGFYRLSNLGFRLAAGAHVLKRDDFTAIEEATSLLADAEEKAAAIVREAEEAYEREKLRGYQDGLAEAGIESVERLLTESHVLDQNLARIERDLSRLVAASVRKLIEGFDDEIRAEAVVTAALKQMRREKRAELRVPIALYEHFRTRIGAITKEFPEIDLVDVVEDPSLAARQIVVETSIGRVDVDLSQRLDDLEAAIRSTHTRAADDAARDIGHAS